MQTALVLMTILGCDDGVANCEYIDTPDQRYVSVELCDAASEQVLAGYGNVNYPTVVAVCRKPEEAGDVATLTGDAAAPPTGEPVWTEPTSGDATATTSLAARAIDTIREALPGKAKIKMVFETPVHVIADGYSWVAHKIRRD